MKKLLLFVLLVNNAIAATFQGSEFVEGEILIKYFSNTTSTFQKNSIESYGGKRLKRLDNRGLSHVKIPKGANIAEVIDQFWYDEDIEYAQPNYKYKITAVPNDTYYGRLWGLKNSAQTIVNTSLGGPDTVWPTSNPGTLNKDMKLETAWNTITNCSSVIVAVLDTGVNYNHNDLTTNMWNGGVTYPNHGYDYVDTDNNPMDLHGHGTHVAGTIGAIGNNALGITGVCWNASIMAVRVLDATGAGTTASIISGITFAKDNGAKVINMSLGGGGAFDTAYSNAITAARTAGTLLVVAAGNSTENVDSGSTPTYPCSFTQDNILCVAALDQAYNLASFSNYGSTSVDVGAPGVNIVSTWPGTHTTTSDPLTTGWNFSTGWGYNTFGGTNSIANPSTYDYGTQTYANNAAESIWKSFNLTGKDVAILNFSIKLDFENGPDGVYVLADTTGADPLNVLAGYTSTTNGLSVDISYNISTYISATTSMGFYVASDATTVDKGVQITNFSLKTLALNNSTYNVISGTSMATPNVAGLATMIFAQNPNYTYLDVIDSIKSGGESQTSLNTKTTSGKSVNAANSIAYIQAPTGGAAVVQP